jgi:hypothetical protein
MIMVLGTQNPVCAALLGADGRRLGPVGWVARSVAGSGRAFLAVVMSACAVGLVTASGATAAQGHALVLSFPKSGELSLSLESKEALSGGIVSGLAVNDVSHDVYVADTGNHRVDEFSAAGGLVRAWGWGVATGASELQVCTASCLPGLSGSAPGQFERPTWIAVDNDSSSASAGDVYVGDTEDDLVTKFDAEGHLVPAWGNNGENASHERVEANGQLNGETSPKKEAFNLSEAPDRERPLSGMAVDGSGDLWVFTRESKLFEFASSGAFARMCLDDERAVNPRGIAVGSGLVWIVDASGRVQRIHESECLDDAAVEPSAVTSSAHPADDLALDTATGDLFVDAEGLFIEDFPAQCVHGLGECEAVQSFGGQALSEGLGIAVDSASGALYAADLASESIFEFAVVVEATATGATNGPNHSAVLHGEVNPLGDGLSQCEFEYGETVAYGSVAPCEESVESIGEGHVPVPVQATVSGLSGGSDYHFRLRAVDKKGEADSEDEQFSTAKTARIVEVSARELTGSTASLTAVIDHEGVSGGQYHFEYGECASLAACVSSPFPERLSIESLSTGKPVSGGSGEEVSVDELASGLAPHGIYHFRVVVEDENGTAFPDPEGTFVFEPPVATCETERPQKQSDGLPDCRAYEMVTPPAKNGALVSNGAFMIPPAIAADGSRVLAKSIQCFGGASFCTGARHTEGEPYQFERTSDGWRTTPLAISGFTGTTMISYDADTGLVLYAAPPAEGATENLYVRQRNGELSLVGPLQEQPGLAVANEAADSPLVATSDFSHMAYIGKNLWKFDESNHQATNTYEYPGVEGHAMLVGVTGSEKGSTDQIGICGAALGGTSGIVQYSHDLSSDGRSVVFAAQPCEHGTGANKATPVPSHQLYERVEKRDGSMATVHISVHSSSDCDALCQATTPRAAAYQGASSNESRVFFTSTQQLTDSASEDKRPNDIASFDEGCILAAAGSSGCNLYMFECPSHCEDEAQARVSDVSAGDISGRGPEVLGVMAVAEDGSSVYFVARGVLTGANREGVQPSPGGNNLYAYRVGGSGEGHIAFVGTLAQSDAESWIGSGLGIANATPDGRFLVFTSHRGLTKDVSRREGPAQVYRYDADSEELMRVSIGESGFDNNGNSGEGDARIAEPLSQIPSDGRPDPTMSDDGQTVFFESPVGLTPNALNDVPVKENPNVLALNIYEWEADGDEPSESAPACDQPGGCLWLISDGRDVTERANNVSLELFGADSSGRNVFFETADQLVAGDTDSQIDIYDARVGGGFSAAAEVQPCGGLEECHGPPPAGEPAVQAPASSIFSGLGNPIFSRPIGPLVVHLTPAQMRAAKLAKALEVCKRDKRRKRRVACEKAAHKQFGPLEKKVRKGTPKKKGHK